MVKQGWPLQVQEEMEAMSEEIQHLNEQVANRDEDLLNLNQELGELTDRLPVGTPVVARQRTDTKVLTV